MYELEMHKIPQSTLSRSVCPSIHSFALFDLLISKVLEKLKSFCSRSVGGGVKVLLNKEADITLSHSSL